MGKQRMTALDVKASVEEMNAKLAGMRLLNVYDIDARKLLLKFGRADVKCLVLIEHGVRVHITCLNREKPKVPSQFTLRLRKFVRSWRLDSVRQIGSDRVIDFCFGTEETAYHIIVELYAKGNFILTGSDYKIEMLQRRHTEGGLAVGERYPLPSKSLSSPPPRSSSPSQPPATSGGSASSSMMQRIEDEVRTILTSSSSSSASQTLKTVLDGIGADVRGQHFPPPAIEHAILSAGLKPNGKLSQTLSALSAAATDDAAGASSKLEEVVRSVSLALCQLDQQLHRPLQPGGYLVRRNATTATAAAAASEDAAAAAAVDGTSGSGAASSGGGAGGITEAPVLLPATSISAQLAGQTPFDDFTPFLMLQHQGPTVQIVGCQSFGEALDKFFAFFEAKEIQQHNEKKESVVVSKKDKFLETHFKRINALASEEEVNKKKAELLILNAEEVDRVINLMNLLLASKQSWEFIRKTLKQRQASGTDPDLNIIHEVHFDRNTVTLLLSEDLSGFVDVEDCDVEPMVVEAKLSQNANNNASGYYTHKKEVRSKREKTEKATDKAVSSVEKKGERQAVKKGPTKKDITTTRASLWFEKFYWFVTSTGHVVVCARDSQQSDQLIKKYLRVGDLFVHTDSQGAHVCLLKGHVGKAIPYVAVQEAGTMVVCRSHAWESKACVSAWWVYASQVAKTSPDGSFLNAGQFHILGKKNFIRAMPLVLGATLVFRVTRRQEAFGSGVVPSSATEASSNSTPAATSSSSPVDDATGGGELAAIPPEDPNKPVGTMLRASPSSTPTPFDVNALLNTSTGTAHSSRGHTSSESSEPPSPIMMGVTAAAGVAGGAIRSPLTLGHGAFPTSPLTSRASRASSAGGASARSAGTGDDASSDVAISISRGSDKGSSTTPGSVSAVVSGGGSSAAMPKTRRQLSKMKKIQKKYGEQDDDEREQRMALLGNKPSQLHKIIAQEESKDHSSLSAVSQQLSSGSALRKTPQSGGDGDTTDDGGGPASLGNTQRSSSGIGGKKEVKFADKQEELSTVVDESHEEMRRRSSLLEEEEQKTIERIDREAIEEVPFFTGSPAKNDTILYALLICAPFSCVFRNAFRVELTPGVEKKGVVADTVLHQFANAVQSFKPLVEDNDTTTNNSADAESDATSGTVTTELLLAALKRIEKTEAINQLIGGAKIHIRGMGAAKKDLKQQKQQARKADVAAAAAAAAASASASKKATQKAAVEYHSSSAGISNPPSPEAGGGKARKAQQRHADPLVSH